MPLRTIIQRLLACWKKLEQTKAYSHEYFLMAWGMFSQGLYHEIQSLNYQLIEELRRRGKPEEQAEKLALSIIQKMPSPLFREHLEKIFLS